jgi:hypothetical protein
MLTVMWDGQSVKSDWVWAEGRELFFPVCAITASGVPGGTLISMNRFSTLCG